MNSYARVRVFPVNSQLFQIYIPDVPKGHPSGYPATAFLQYIKNQDSWTHDTLYVDVSGSWMTAFSKANGGAWNYLHNSSDGVFFNGTKYGVTTFPGNVVKVIDQKYRKGENWDELDTLPYTPTAPDFMSLPAHQLSYQTGMNFANPTQIYPAPVNGGAVVVPLINKGLPLWLEDQYIELFPSVPMQITATCNLNMRVGGWNSDWLETVMKGSVLTLTDYYPLFNRTYGKVTDPATGISGFVSLAYYIGRTLLYTTTWTMQTPPIPPA